MFNHKKKKKKRDSNEEFNHYGVMKIFKMTVDNSKYNLHSCNFACVNVCARTNFC